MSTKRRWSEIALRLDVDAFEEAIGWIPTETDHKGNDIGHCPDIWGLHKHGDSTGKFAIHREKKVYNCWVCGGGSLLSLAMEIKRLDEPTALDWLDEFTSDETLSNQDFETEIEALLAEDQRLKSVWPHFNQRVIERPPYRDNHPWFKERGIPEWVVTKYHLKYNPEAHRRTKKGEYTGPGIILPHFWNGRLVGWQTRWLDDDRPKWIKKYTNTTDFPAEETIFNYETVYLSHYAIVVCESVPTVLRLAGLHVPAVSTFGGGISEEQLRLLRSCQQGIIVAHDNDKVGRKFAGTLVKGLERFVGISVIKPVGEEGDGDDLADLDDDREIMKRVVAATEEHLLDGEF